VQEERGHHLIKVLFLVFDKFNVKQPLIHLGGPLEKRRILGGFVQDVNDEENCNIEQDEKAGHGHELKVGKEAVLDHVEIILVPLLGRAGLV
jgi:hypothetical protein